MNLQELNSYYREKEGYFMELWKEFLRFNSISPDPECNASCQRCAEWVVGRLTKLGVKTELLKTSSKPVVYGELAVPGATRTVLIYGHYDVQPVDPLELWHSNPFEPQIRDGRMYARGAQDNKGQVSFILAGIEYLIQSKQLRCNLRFFIEGEEECGSEGFLEILPALGKRAVGDVLMVCDTGTMKPGIGTITMGLRGIIGLTVTLRGPNKDLHSGIHGGMVRNPATELARLVASLHDANGRIAVPGYYDGVMEIDPQDKKFANGFPLTSELYQQMTGAKPLGGELSFTPAERVGFRPTIEVNGFHSGYGGPGGKTIVPSEAVAKLTSRLVVGQDPKRCLKLIIEHLKRHTPAGVEIDITEAADTGGAIQLSSKSKLIGEARAVLTEVTGQEPFLFWFGSSVPLVATLSTITGAEPLLVGFGLEEDNIHAPNESFALEQFRQGFLYTALMIGRL